MSIKDAVSAWARSQTNREVIFRDQDGKQPSVPYVTIKVTSSSREGQADVMHEVSDEGVVTIKQGMLFTLSVQTYGDDILGIMNDLRSSLNKWSVQNALRQNGICYVQVLSEPSDISAITGTTWQQRATMDVQFRTDVSITDDVGIIESVQFTGEADGLTVTKFVGEPLILDEEGE